MQRYTLFAVNVMRKGWLLALMGLPLTVTPCQVGNFFNLGHPLVDGLSFAVIPPPVLTGVSGCQGQGATTLDCVVDLDVLTIYGTGFSFFSDQYGFQSDIGSYYYDTNSVYDTCA